MTTENSKPRVGLLALSLELYEELAPELRAGRERWLRETVLPALDPLAAVHFDRAVFRREDIEATVSNLEAEGVDALLIICLTYAPSQIVLPALQRTRLPIVVWNTQELFAVDESFGNENLFGFMTEEEHRARVDALPDCEDEDEDETKGCFKDFTEGP